ncbi:restriction endonuclease subunit S [Arcobacter roscoffensis]|uniref:Restriction endonuclease subunit S n=1 Tax=Arcobacter roscoffensis TaxID=2961520 RepID=A0ABY5E1Z9_9BACT|nr:restriction endonuclease subunit S [Arcobacter roscoffensis]UTJ05589.1 restriction endonuclease subunit S [Arcobacter roscoffensis]
MSNIPQERFKGFDDEWIEKSYGDIYNFYSTNSLSREKLNYEKGEIYNIHYGDIHTKFSTTFDIEKEEVPYINSDIDTSRIKDESYCQIGDLIIADASEDYKDIGKTIEIVNLDSKKLLAGLHTFLARPEKLDIALGFMGYMLQSWKARKQIMREAQGTKVLGLSMGRLSKVKLYIPSDKEEQEKIALFLESIDKKIEQLSNMDELLNEYKKGAIQKIFNQEIRFKKDDGSKFANWKSMKFLDLFDNFGGTSLEKYINKNGKYNIVSIGNYTKDGKYIDNQQKIDLNEKSKTKLLNKNDLVMVLNDKTSTGDIIGSSILIDEDNKYIYNQRSERLICKKTINPLFAWHLLNSNKVRKRVFSLSQGGTQIYVNFPSIKKMELLIPHIDEQSKIANFLSLIDKKMENNQNILEQTKEFKKGLLQRMFV